MIDLKHSSKRAHGFTLVEMAIVLVIIGLLLGGVLKGQELVVQARVKSIINDFNQVTAAYYTYFDRYRRFPGDDASASTRWSEVGVGDGNGVLKGVFSESTTATDETNLLWAHLRWADIINGEKNKSGTVAAVPTNAVGGKTGIQDAEIFGITKTVICMSAISGKLAQLVDYAIDDGKTDSGIVRAKEEETAGTPVTTGNATTSGTVTGYNEAKTFTVCRQL